MDSITIRSNRSVLETVDIDKAMQRGRRLRAMAFTSILRSLFGGQRAEHGQWTEPSHQKGGFAPDCAAAA